MSKKYNQTYPREWEEISNGTSRMKVPREWIVSDIQYGPVVDETEFPVSSSMVFVPDPLHEWKLES